MKKKISNMVSFVFVFIFELLLNYIIARLVLFSISDGMAAGKLLSGISVATLIFVLLAPFSLGIMLGIADFIHENA